VPTAHKRYMGAQALCTEQKIKIVLIALLETSVSSIINETVWNKPQPPLFVIQAAEENNLT